MKVGDPPAFPTPIDACPKCKEQKGFIWHWGQNDGKGTGYSECKGCKAKL
jgi:hypothetical protein